MIATGKLWNEIKAKSCSVFWKMLSWCFSTCGKMRQNRHKNSSQFALVIFSQHESFRILMQYINGKCNFSMVKTSVLQLTLRIRQDKTHTCRSRYRSAVHSEITGQELHHSVYLIKVLKFYTRSDYFVDSFYPRTKPFLCWPHHSSTL